MNKTIFCCLALLAQGTQAQTPDPFLSAPAADLRRLSGPRWDAAVASLTLVRERRSDPMLTLRRLPRWPPRSGAPPRRASSNLASKATPKSSSNARRRSRSS
ncbi:hypothetical protein LP420_06785 [Massilia sp. B-10]|nr:hypothetical protein LP420_06785 [Massilia sp. B-10]